MLIPTEPQQKVLDLSSKVVGIYGRAGIGKSTLANCFDGVLFAATEAGLSHLDGVYKVDVPTYDIFLDLCKEFTTTEHPYKTLCIDTFDNLVKLCVDWTCKRLSISDLSEYKRKFGAYHFVTKEVHRIIAKLSLLPYGLILTSHYAEEEMNSPTNKWQRATISIGGKNKSIMLDICDPLLFMDSRMDGDKEVGVIKTKPSIYWDAKDKSTLLPAEIIYDLSNPKEAFDIIYNSYNESTEEK